jgi:hypothetical protein
VEPGESFVKLPGADRAVVDLRKLAEYCLSDDHLRGRHKARAFRSALGITAIHASWLREQLLQAAADSDAAVATEADSFGRRYVLDFKLDGPRGVARVRSCWIVRGGEDFSRLTSCYVL